MDEDAQEESYDDEVTPEEKITVFQHMMKRVPAGEASDVVGIFAELLNKDGTLIDDDKKKESLKLRAEEFNAPVDGVIVSKSTSLGEAYLDPKKGQSCDVDFLTGNVTRSEAEYENSDKRQEIESALGKYAKAHYLTGSVKGYSCSVVEKEGDFVVLISAEYTDTPNKLTGSWSSEFTISGTSLKGTTKINAHYFEAGNTQLKTTTTHSEDLDGDDAASIVKGIKLVETELQQKLLNFFSSAETHWGKVRRMLTIQGTKFAWNLAKHSLVSGQTGN